MHRHPQNIPVVEYYRLNGVNFTYCWRAGSTSIASLALNNNAEVLGEPPETCVLLLKHPIERFRSSHMILPDKAYRIGDERVIQQMPMDDYINGVLDNVEGVRSPHCWPQMEQHEAVKELEIFRLEGSTHIAAVELPKLNITEVPKPEISTHPRYHELFTYYERDLEAWEQAEPLHG